MSGRHFRVSDYLGHILQAINRIYRYTQGISKAEFMEDEKGQDAVIRNFEIIGEAANKILTDYPEFAAQHSDIPWEVAYGMRNRLVHGYFEINLEVVWSTAQISLPKLEYQIQRLQGELARRAE
jgi:uncharacterized protein with HEPN domain